MKWYVIKTANGKEKQVKDALELRLGNFSKTTELLIPSEKVYHTKNGKKYLREKNFYPGYLFVKSNAIGEIEHILKEIKQSHGFLGKERPEPLRESEVEKMLGKIDEVACETNAKFEYIKGENIIIIDGPFNSFNGIVKDVDHKRQKVKLNVKIFGRNTPLELNFDQIQKVY